MEKTNNINISSSEWLQQELDKIQPNQKDPYKKLVVINTDWKPIKNEKRGKGEKSKYTFLIRKQHAAIPLSIDDLGYIQTLKRNLTSINLNNNINIVIDTRLKVEEPRKGKYHTANFRLKIYLDKTEKNKIDSFLFDLKHRDKDINYKYYDTIINNTKTDPSYWITYYTQDFIDDITIGCLLEEIEAYRSKLKASNSTNKSCHFNYKLTFVRVKRYIPLHNFKYQEEFIKSKSFDFHEDAINEIRSWSDENPGWEWNID